ncbi:MAG: hypothetical protein K6G62_05105 [Eubacterium sp.]|nr:hypothetical protein [Eubacterium sp.]
MYECPNCSGNLLFNIEKQMLSCPSCNSDFDPYEVTKEKDGEESQNFDVTVFTCPQCAGEIYSTDNQAAAFCSFCGASTILTSRLKQEKYPDYIIPFKKTKADCKKSYLNLMKKAIYAPGAIKKQSVIDSFRGIYMPYWLYNYDQHGNFLVTAKKSYRKGNYDITDYYNVDGRIDGHYYGIPHDGSSSFSDEISERITPFEETKMQPFTASMLSGFYADTTDVDESVYYEEAELVPADYIAEEMKKTIRKEQKLTYDPGDKKKVGEKTCLERTSVKKAMFPVWFMSYRNGDRVSYATVNGQTGKVAADIPISKPKYFLGTVIIAILIYLFLEAIFTFTPGVLINILAVLSVIVSVVYMFGRDKIIERENYVNDTGMQDLLRRQGKATKRKKKPKGGFFPAGVSVIINVIFFGFFFLFPPVSDIPYYVCAMISMFFVGLTLIDLINKYNLMVTSPMPQFAYTGGDDDAN